MRFKWTMVLGLMLIVCGAYFLYAQGTDNCCGIDRQCSTEKEWNDGYWAYQDGQCAAPAQSNASAPAQSNASASPASSSSGSTASQIDNCCFIDTQCSTDQEWTDGYWAYQNGQCAAPAQNNVSASGGASASQIDNCCNVDRSCVTDQDWTGGYWAYLNSGGQCGANASSDAPTEEPSQPQVIYRSRKSAELAEQYPHLYETPSGNIVRRIYGMCPPNLPCETPTPHPNEV